MPEVTSQIEVIQNDKSIQINLIFFFSKTNVTWKIEIELSIQGAIVHIHLMSHFLECRRIKHEWPCLFGMLHLCQYQVNRNGCDYFLHYLKKSYCMAPSAEWILKSTPPTPTGSRFSQL